jgi:hypothetical protein
MRTLTASVLHFNVLLSKPMRTPQLPVKGRGVEKMGRALSRQTMHAAISGLATAALIMVSSPVAGSAGTRWDAETSSSPIVPEFFDGGGYGPTAEVARTLRSALALDGEGTLHSQGVSSRREVRIPDG